MVGDLLPSATVKILLQSDGANQFTGVVHFVLSHNKPLIPGLETDLDSVCAGWICRTVPLHWDREDSCSRTVQGTGSGLP